MLYRLFEYLNNNPSLPGMRIGEYLSFRSAAAIILSLLIAIFFGKRIIRFLTFRLDKYAIEYAEKRKNQLNKKKEE